MQIDSPIISDILPVFTDIFSDIVGGNVPNAVLSPILRLRQGLRRALTTSNKRQITRKVHYFIFFLALFLYHDSLRFPGPHLDQCARKSLIINNRHFLHREATI